MVNDWYIDTSMRVQLVNLYNVDDEASVTDATVTAQLRKLDDSANIYDPVSMTHISAGTYKVIIPGDIDTGTDKGADLIIKVNASLPNEQTVLKQRIRFVERQG